MEIPASPTRRIQRSLSAVQTLGGGNSSSSLVPPTLNASNSDLPPLSELSPSGQAVRGAWATLKARESSLWDRVTAAKVLLFLTFEDPSSSKVAWYTNLLLISAILINCASFIGGSLKQNMFQPTDCKHPVCVPGPDSICTEPVCHPREKDAFYQVELWTIAVFTVDYLVRVLTVHAVQHDLINPRSFDVTVDGRLIDRNANAERHGVVKTFKYMLQWLNIIDVVSILPFFIEMALKISTDTDDLGVLRVLRLLRVIRVFKLGRYSEGGMLLGRTLKASLPALVLFVFLITILTIVFGSLMFFFEMGTFMVTPAYPHGAFFRPNSRHTGYELSPFNSILMGIYWTIVNTTTLGNAALYPTTTLGRLVSCFVAYAGILAIALPISIVGKNFTEQYNLIYGAVGGAFEGKADAAIKSGNTSGPSGPALLSVTAGIDKSIAASLSAQASPHNSVLIRRQSSNRRLGRSRSNSGLEDIFTNPAGANPPSRPNSRSSTPKTMAAGGGALPYPGGVHAAASTPGGVVDTPARPRHAAASVASTPLPAAVQEAEASSQAMAELQAQLRALREELASLAPLRQEVDALRGQLRELQQKQ